MHFIFDTLVWKNETAGPIPLLANDWDYSPEEDAYVFNLAENATWHDGEPVTADDVAFTISSMRVRSSRSWARPVQGRPHLHT